MKKLFGIFCVSALVVGLVSCTQKELEGDNLSKEGFVEVQFDAISNPFESASKATLTPNDGDAEFTAAWDSGDKIGVYYSNASKSGITEGTWGGENFTAKLPEYIGEWTYDAVFPMPNTSNENKVDFGSVRTQKGSAYNSLYDLMEAETVSVSNAAAGKDDEGNNIQFKFDRITAIAYFHLTSDLSDPITKATLSVTGGYIANTCVKMDNSQKFVFAENLEGDETITVTFPESAPTANEFKLWFNVNPTSYTTMSLTVETATKTCTINKNKAGSFVAGKLYKVSKDNLTWTRKKVEVSTTENFTASNAASNAYDCNSALGTDDNRADFNYTWAADSYNGTVWKNGVKLGSSKAIGSLSCSDILTDIPTGDSFTIKIFCAQWNADGGNISVTYNDEGKDEEPANESITVTSNAYSADDFAESNNFTFTKVSGKETITIASTLKRILIDKIEVVHQEDAKLKLDAPADLTVTGMNVTWGEVSHAGGYKLSIDGTEYDVTGTSYTFEGTAGYYDVSVYAIPSDFDNYKNSDAATLSKAKFGTPKLATPVLTSGGVTETSVIAKWDKTDFASNGYHCELYLNGEVKGSCDTDANTTSVTFDELVANNEYTVKVNAKAVEGDFSYEASNIAEIKLTPVKVQVKDITKEGSYAITGLLVYAIPNYNIAILGDTTGKVLLFKSGHGLSVGQIIDVSGDIEKYNGIWEFSSSLTIKDTGTTGKVDHGTAIELSDLTDYTTNPIIKYIHTQGAQSDRTITPDDYLTNLYMSSSQTETDGCHVDTYGYVYGYKTSINYCPITLALDDIKTSVSSITLGSEAGSTAKVIVKSSGAWTANSSENSHWTVSPNSGEAGSTEVTITATNAGGTTEVTLDPLLFTLSETQKATVAVKQDGAIKLEGFPVNFTASNYSTGVVTKVGTATWTSNKDLNTTTNGVYFQKIEAGAYYLFTIPVNNLLTSNTIELALAGVKVSNQNYIATYTFSYSLDDKTYTSFGDTYTETTSGASVKRSFTPTQSLSSGKIYIKMEVTSGGGTKGGNHYIKTVDITAK